MCKKTQKVAKKGPKSGTLLTVPSMGTLEFLIDFQDFLKIDLEITQCQQALVPVLLLFGKSLENSV